MHDAVQSWCCTCITLAQSNVQLCVPVFWKKYNEYLSLWASLNSGALYCIRHFMCDGWTHLFIISLVRNMLLMFRWFMGPPAIVNLWKCGVSRFLWSIQEAIWHPLWYLGDYALRLCDSCVLIGEQECLNLSVCWWMPGGQSWPGIFCYIVPHSPRRSFGAMKPQNWRIYTENHCVFWLMAQ